jgi:hypothetical protein
MSSSEGVLNYFDVRDQCMELYKSLDGLSEMQKSEHPELIRLASQRVRCSSCGEVIIYREAPDHNMKNHDVIYTINVNL